MVSRKKKPGFDSEVLKETSYYFKNGEEFSGALWVELTFCRLFCNLTEVCAMWNLTTSLSRPTPKVAGWGGQCMKSSQKSFKQRRQSTTYVDAILNHSLSLVWFYFLLVLCRR